MKTHTSQYFVYIMSNFYNTVLYIGFTNDLMRRVSEHKQDATDGFTQKYNCHKLVYAEVYDTPEEAMRREKQLKKWNRAWKEALIDQKNKERIDLSMDWESLYETLFY